ncbi:MAG: type II secretion system GspH family protein [Planctomycetes bacterium]|nr:type II secretion system GspH family protein [Planctomycetota bacterium]
MTKPRRLSPAESYARARRRTAAGGFTLVEVLVVIGIIVLLAGIAMPALNLARKHSMKKVARTDMNAIAVAVGAYESDFGDFPPSSLEFLEDGKFSYTGNGVNAGIESLVACLTTRRKGGPYLDERFRNEQALANTDKDALVDSALKEHLDSELLEGSDELWELIDPFGNPLVYVHFRDYTAGSFEILGGKDGAFKKIMATPARSEALGTFHNSTSFQIWSLGPDGKNEDGGGDDLGSWQ